MGVPADGRVVWGGKALAFGLRAGWKLWGNRGGGGAVNKEDGAVDFRREGGHVGTYDWVRVDAV
jgi:hypothetical protein